MKKWTLVVLLAMGPRPVAADDPAAPGPKGSEPPGPKGSPPPTSHGSPPPVAEGNQGLQWIQPSPVPPVATGRAVRGTLPAALRAPEAPVDELAGLRAVSLREGHGTIALGGTTRAVQRGDRLGSAVVKAVGSDRIVLERPLQPGGPQGQPAREAATMVVTFGPGGEARVRVYALVGAAIPPPEVR